MCSFSRSRSLTHTGFGIRCQEAHARAGSFLYSIYHAACLIKNTEGKRHHTEEFKDRIGWESRWVYISSTIQCLQRKLCYNSGHYTKDHNRAVKHKLGERLGVQKPVWRTKADFLGSFCLQTLAGTQSGPMGISTFLPNKEQGFHVRNWATAMDQLTSPKPFLCHLFHCLPGKLSRYSPLFERYFAERAWCLSRARRQRSGVIASKHLRFVAFYSKGCYIDISPLTFVLNNSVTWPSTRWSSKE